MSSSQPPPDPQRVLDVKGHDCPMPILKTRMALSEMERGEVIRVLATDPHSVLDFRAFCARTGHVLEAHREEEGVFEFFVRRRG